MNYIGIDISKISTGMVIETNGKEYIFSYNTNKPTYKWNKAINDICKIRTYEYDNTIEEYTKKEIDKLTQFINISNDIVEDALSVIDKKEDRKSVV